MADLMIGGLATLHDAGNLLRTLENKCAVTVGIQEVERSIKKITSSYLHPKTIDLQDDAHSTDTDTPEERETISQTCPMGLDIYSKAQEEFRHVQSAHRTITATGCSADFCQSGRATKIFEPRVGRNRPLTEIKSEVVEFLRECHDKKVIDSDKSLCERIQSALKQVEQTSRLTKVAHDDGRVTTEAAGGTWEQTSKELEYGIRAAWKNSKKCIMRSEYANLSLCDLRHFTTSHDMAHALVANLSKAFNGGRIQPTVFVFKPRLPDQRGPMIWNEQLLAFAGYKQRDGSVIGDTNNVELTSAMIQLGWKPPLVRTRWDILPLVIMADGDNPYMIELPVELKRRVRITHPRFRKEFERLDLRWIMFPALSRLGFDIGGMQYTAAPFLGWFMDAEIGVRNLADTFRYNALPDVVEALSLSDYPDRPFEDLPEYLRLAALSRAQAELNLAVYYSYEQEKVMMIDTMTASMNYMQFDDTHMQETGYRLPADPYWLAPPQGSIIPLWHRGAAPNYQPKPMIARHVQDPIKAWRREHPYHVLEAAETNYSVETKCPAKQKVLIFTCSDGITAGKLGKRLHTRLEEFKKTARLPLSVLKPQSLNSLLVFDCDKNDTILIIASTTGRGELPRNAKTFVERHKDMKPLSVGPRFSVYGNGDSTHGYTYNAVPKLLHKVLSNLGCVDPIGAVVDGDTATQNPDWDTFNPWTQQIQHLLMGGKVEDEFQIAIHQPKSSKIANEMMIAWFVRKKRFVERSLTLVTLDIGNVQYKEMDHFKIMVPSLMEDISLVMQALGVEKGVKVGTQDIDVFSFLEQEVDLTLSFKTLDWLCELKDISEEEKLSLLADSVTNVLRSLDQTPHIGVVEKILHDMPSNQPRHFSAASSPVCSPDPLHSNELQLLVKVNTHGRFSSDWLSDAQPADSLRFCLARSGMENFLLNLETETPVIMVATGSGMGPVRSFLQRRIKSLKQSADDSLMDSPMTDQSSYCGHDSSCGSSFKDLKLEDESDYLDSSSTSTCGSQCCSRQSQHIAMGRNVDFVTRSTCSLSLFVGFKSEDRTMIEEIVRPADEAGLFGCLEFCESNILKERIQDRLLDPRIATQLACTLRHPQCAVYVCANAQASEGAIQNFSQIIGEDIREYLGYRIVEEVFGG